jgi:hypothetical protein
VYRGIHDSYCELFPDRESFGKSPKINTGGLPKFFECTSNGKASLDQLIVGYSGRTSGFQGCRGLLLDDGQDEWHLHWHSGGLRGTTTARVNAFDCEIQFGVNLGG